MTDLRTMDYKTMLRRVMFLWELRKHHGHGAMVTVADYTRIFCVHRNTARRHLKRFAELGLLDEEKRYYRSNAHRCIYRFTDKAHVHADFMLGPDRHFPF
jgi:predicted transcriptional regulator